MRLFHSVTRVVRWAALLDDPVPMKICGSFHFSGGAMGLLTFGINVTLDGCIDHQEGVVDDETHAFFTSLMDAAAAMLWGRVTYEMMEGYWPAVARGDVEAPAATREWAAKLQVKPKYVVSSARKDFPWDNSFHIAGDLQEGVQALKDATPGGRTPGQRQARGRAGPAGSDRRVPVPPSPPDRRSRPDPVRERADGHAAAGANLIHAAAQRRHGHALPACALTRLAGSLCRVAFSPVPEISSSFLPPCCAPCA